MRIRIWPDPIDTTGPEFKPHLWYAWHPVLVKKWFYDAQGHCVGSRLRIVWLEKVDRVLVGCDIFGYSWQYKFPEGSE